MRIFKDKYVLAMEYLHAHPDKISDAWRSGGDPNVPGAVLFGYAGDPNGDRIGCLTMIQQDCSGSSDWEAATPSLTDEIRNDARIPATSDDITPEHLNVFAEWQRRLDKELGR